MTVSLQSYETVRLDPGTMRIDALYWSGDDDYLLLQLDEMGISGSIWAMPIQPSSQAYMVGECGVLLDALHAPAKEVAPAAAIPTIKPGDLPTGETSPAGGPVILFVRDDDLWRADSNSLVDVTAPDQLRRVVPGAPISAWSPDSRYLAYAVNDKLLALPFEEINMRRKILFLLVIIITTAFTPSNNGCSFCSHIPEPYLVVTIQVSA